MVLYCEAQKVEKTEIRHKTRHIFDARSNKLVYFNKPLEFIVKIIDRVQHRNPTSILNLYI